MITVYKYPLTITRCQSLDVDGYMRCLSAKEVRGKLVLYIMVDTDPSLQTITMSVLIQGTGKVASQTEDYRFVDSVVMKDGMSVWHVFIKEPE